MVKRKKPSEEDGHRLWWEKTFKEREDLLRDLIGQTDPPGYVISFSWTDVNLVIPGACVCVSRLTIVTVLTGSTSVTE